MKACAILAYSFVQNCPLHTKFGLHLCTKFENASWNKWSKYCNYGFSKYTKYKQSILVHAAHMLTVKKLTLKFAPIMLYVVYKYCFHYKCFIPQKANLLRLRVQKCPPKYNYTDFSKETNIIKMATWTVKVVLYLSNQL